MNILRNIMQGALVKVLAASRACCAESCKGTLVNQTMKATATRSLVLFLLLLPASPVLADFAGGDGSASDPWQIATAEQLDEVRNDLTGHYILTADIDLTEATGDSSGAFWNGGAGWKPIGRSLGDSFIGSLDGNGFTITGLFIDRSGDDHAGLFGWISFGAELTGLTLEAVDITGGSLVGGLVVTNFGGTVENSSVTGSVSGNEFVGGLVARNLSGSVRNSRVTGQVSSSERAGGLVGINWSTVTDSDLNTEAGSPANDLEGSVSEFSGAVSVTGTGVFNGVRVTGAIGSVRLPEAFDPDDAGAGGDGELTLISDDARTTMLPYSVKRASPGQEEGLFTNEDGDIVLVTADGRELLSHPVLADRAALTAALQELDLELQYGESATMRLSPASGAAAGADYYSARADMLAVQLTSAEEEGLFFREVPGLQGTTVAYLIFRDENGMPMLQELVPVPADWRAMKNSLSATGGIREVRMDPQGIISVAVNGQAVRGRMEYEVSRGATEVEGAGDRAVLTSVGDVNGDGTEDFRVLYPGGDVQLLMIFP